MVKLGTQEELQYNLGDSKIERFDHVKSEFETNSMKTQR
jgi:hypothetical protein